MHYCVVWLSHIPLRDSSGFSPDSLVFLLRERTKARTKAKAGGPIAWQKTYRITYRKRWGDVP